MSIVCRVFVVLLFSCVLISCVKNSGPEFDYCGTAERLSGEDNPDWYRISNLYTLCLEQPMKHSERLYFSGRKNNAEEQTGKNEAPLAMSEGTPKEYYEKGIQFIDDGIYDVAIRYLTKAVELDPQYAQAYNDRGFAYEKIGNDFKAMSDYERSIEIDPDHYYYYFSRGSLRHDHKDYKGAVEDYSKAIDLNPTDSFSYAFRGLSWRKLRHYSKAHADCTKSIQLDPNEATHYSNRGSVRISQQNYKGALDDYTKVIELDPKYYRGYLERGKLRLKTGDNRGAVEDFNRLLELSTRGSYYFYRGNALLNMHHYEAAIEDYTAVIMYNGQDAKTYAKRAFAYFGNNELDKARIDAEKAKKLDQSVSVPQF